MTVGWVLRRHRAGKGWEHAEGAAGLECQAAWNAYSRSETGRILAAGYEPRGAREEKTMKITLVLLAASLTAICAGEVRETSGRGGSELAQDDDVMRVHFIDVGQGDATLLEFPAGVALIDAGGERYPKQEWKPAKFDGGQMLMDYLEAFFEENPKYGNRLNLLVITHPHKDHTLRIPDVLERYKPKNVVHNGQWKGSGIEGQDIARDYLRDSEASGWYVLNRTIEPGRGFSNETIDPIGGVAGGTDPGFQVLWGQVVDQSDWKWNDFSDENNHSIVLRVDFGRASLLFTGDLEESRKGKRSGIERLLEKHKGSDVLDVDVYQVGHHGSHNGNSDELMAAMTPKIAVISCGPPTERGGYSAWEHAHPRTETIKELESGVSCRRPPLAVEIFDRHDDDPRAWTIRKAIYCTGWDGTVVLEAKPNGFWSVIEPLNQTLQCD